jgi:hypothetical protein
MQESFSNVSWVVEKTFFFETLETKLGLYTYKSILHESHLDLWDIAPESSKLLSIDRGSLSRTIYLKKTQQ